MISIIILQLSYESRITGSTEFTASLWIPTIGVLVTAGCKALGVMTPGSFVSWLVVFLVTRD